MYTKEQSELYDEMCRVVGDVVFTMHDLGIESKQIVITDWIKTALTMKNDERSELQIKAMKIATKTLDT